MHGNFENPVGNSGLDERNERSSETINDTQPAPVTVQPEQFSRSYIQKRNCDKTNSSSYESGGEPLHNYAAFGQEGLKTSHHSDQTEILKPESVVINLDNVSEPSTSHSMDLHGHHTEVPERFQQNISLQESSGSNDQHNLLHQIRETIADIVNTHENFSCHNNKTSSGIRNNNNDNGTGDNNNSSSSSSSSSHSNDTLVNQNNEGSPAENPNPESQELDEVLKMYNPFVSFLLFKVIYDHREGFLIFIVLLLKFIHANYVVKREIAKQNRRSLISLGIVFTNLSVGICFIYFVFQDQHLYEYLIFIPPHLHPLSVWDVFWIVGITDFILKFITIQLKIGLTCLPAKLLPYSARGKWYLLLEGTSQLYRGLVPVQAWFYYLMEVYKAPDSNVGMFFLIAYLFSKWSDMKAKTKLFLRGFCKLLDNTSLGIHPTAEQLVTAGTQCPICHEEYISPIILPCKHTFCECCALMWFARERTCPLCRAKIADDPAWKDGATSLFTQLF